MDRFRRENAALRAHVESRAQDELQRARWLAFGFVMLFSATVLSLGMVALERQARRDRARSKQRREYVDALQGADDEREAKELLRRRAERLDPRLARGRAHPQRERQLARGEHRPVRRRGPGRRS